MLNDFIEDNELLFRAIKPFPNWWKVEINRPSSAAFKDSNGVSVDRQGSRTLQTTIEAIKNRFEIKAVVSITAQECRNTGANPMPKPTRTNPEHAEIHGGMGKIQLSSSQARAICKSVNIEYLS